MPKVMRSFRRKEAVAIGLLVMVGVSAPLADAGAAGGARRIAPQIRHIMSQAQYRMAAGGC